MTALPDGVTDTFTFTCQCDGTVHVVGGVQQPHDCPLTESERQAIRDAAAEDVDVETLDELVFQALGAVSVCWESIDAAGAFESTRARAIGDELVARLREREHQPRLGYATTQQLLDEITARIEVDGANGGGGLGYRTVG